MTKLADVMKKLFRTARVCLATFGFLALATFWILAGRNARLRRKLPELAWAALRLGFGIEVRVEGAPTVDGNVLFAANHVSWADIVVLGSILDAGFVAKAEVRGWPVIGRLAERYGCSFIARNSRCSVLDQTGDLQQQLAATGRLILFPEGTTGNGAGLLPFRSSLFATTRSVSNCRVQPVAIVWKARDGGVLSAEAMRKIAWIDDDELLEHAMAFALHGALAEIHFLDPIVSEDRKVLARSAHAAIAERLCLAQAATLNRAA